MNIEQIIKEEEMRILKKEFRFLKEDVIIGGAVAGMLIRTFIQVGIQRSRARQIVEKGLKLCDKYEGDKKEICMANVKKVFSEIKIKELYKKKKECDKLKSNIQIQKCHAKITKQIKNESEKLKEYSKIKNAGFFQATDIYGH